MTQDLANLIHWLRVSLIVAAISTTLFPLLYFLTRWYRSVIGRVLMLQSISFAAAVDVTVVFQYWRPHSILLQFWIEVVIFSFIALASAALTLTLLHAQFKRRRPGQKVEGVNDDRTLQG